MSAQTDSGHAETAAEPSASSDIASVGAGKRRGAAIALCLAVLLFLLVGELFVVQIPFLLLFGWVGFLARTLPEIAWHPPAIAMGLLALGGFVAGTHAFADRLWRRAADPARAPWPWRWTLGGSLLLMLLFASGTAMVGGVHQLVWLLTADRSLYRSWMPVREHSVDSELRSAYASILLNDPPVRADAFRRAIAGSRDLHRAGLHIAVLAGPANEVGAVLVQFPDERTISERLRGKRYAFTFATDRQQPVEITDQRLMAFIKAVETGEILDAFIPTRR